MSGVEILAQIAKILFVRQANPMDIFWLMIGIVRVVTRVGLGAFFIFHGLNAFLNWVPIPEPRKELAHFLSVFFSVPTFMTAVKLGQIVAGAGLLLGVGIGVSLLALGVLVFGIVQLQCHLNDNKRLSIQIALFYLVTLILHFREIWFLI